MVLGSIIGAGATLASGLFGADASKDAQKAQQQALQTAQTAFQPFSFFGPGGLVATEGTVDPYAQYLQSGVGPDGQPLELSDARFATGAKGQEFYVRPDGTYYAKLADGTIKEQTEGLIRDYRKRGFLSNLDATALSDTQGFLGRQALATQYGLQDIPKEGLQLNLGDLEDPRAGLVGLASDQIGRAGAIQGLPENVNQAALLQSAFAPGGQQDILASLQNDALSQQGLSQFMLGNRFVDALGNQEGVRQRELDLLRQQAAPFEQRAFQDLQENQFATGRIGTSGGGIQTEAFARGLAQADIDRQLQATNVANQQRSLADQLLQSAFGRFGQSSELASTINRERFGRAGTELASQIQLAGLPAALRQAELGPALQALQGQSGLFTQGLEGFNAALARSTAEANTKIGAGANIADIVGSANFNPGGTSDFLSNIFSGIASNAGSIASGIGSIFGSGSQTPELQEINTAFLPRRI